MRALKEVVLEGRCVSSGRAEGEAIVTKDSIMFNGGINPRTGVVTERGHELEGQSVKDKILVFPYSKGSQGGSDALYQMAMLKVGPRAMICIKAEGQIAVGTIMGNIPFVDKLNQNPLEMIRTGDNVEVDADRGLVKVTRRA